MSQSNRDGKRAARERMAAERLRQQRRDRRRRQLSVVAGVVVVILVVVGIGLGVSLSHNGKGNQAKGTKGAKTPFAAPAGAVEDKYFDASKKPTAIPYGKANAPVTMTVIEDFRCPACQAFEETLGSVYSAYVQEGKLRVLYHPVRLIDSNHPGTTGSMVAGSAAACAQDAGKYFQYHSLLFTNQPNETTDPWAKPSAVLAIAKKVPGLVTPTFTQCVNSGKYEGFVQQNWNDFQKLYGDNLTTPTLLINGKQYQMTGKTVQDVIQNFENALQTAGAGAPPASLKNATATPSASASATPSASPGAGSPSASTKPTATATATNQ